jgi:hypothetical protein
MRVFLYASVVGKESLIADTDCGFTTFADFPIIDPEITWAKLAALGVQGGDSSSFPGTLLLIRTVQLTSP